MTGTSHELSHDDQWRAWQARNVELNHKGALQARVMFGVFFSVASVYLAYQLLSR